MPQHYNTVAGNQSPYASSDPYYNESSGFITPHTTPKRSNNWLRFGIPVVVLIIIGAVLGGVLGSRASKNTSVSSAGSSAAAASSAASLKAEVGRYATATSDPYLMPIYPSTVSVLLRTLQSN